MTVLFGDLSGFSTLSSSLDPEETHALLNRYFETVDNIVRSYGGTIDKHIGDAVMAVFGAPVAHTDDPARAMRAALEIHAALAATESALTVHIGIASGTVVASTTGSDTHREYTVIGDSVNLAARLQDLAQPGETLVTGAVRDAGGADFIHEPLGNTDIKGLPDPVLVCRLISLDANAHRRRDLPFVGRRAELAQFAGALNACASGSGGQVLILRGEPGIGKTRLVEEYRSLAGEHGFAWHGGVVLDFGAGKGLDAIATTVLGLIGAPISTDRGGRPDAVTRALETGLLHDEDRAFVNDLLDLPQPAQLRSFYDAMDANTRAHRRELFVADLLRRVSASRAVVIAIEDVHWADAATMSQLARLAEACTTCPALILMTTRFEGDPCDAGWRAATGGASLIAIDLGPLRTDEALAFARQSFGASERFTRSCVERSGGNPLFLEQLLRAAEEVPQSQLPGSIQSIVLARMDNLDPADRKAMQAASALGQRFSIEPLRHLIEDPAYQCSKLVAHFLVRPLGQEFLFAHALVKEGVYSSLLKAQRTHLHLRAANWFASRDLSLRAEHLDRAGAPDAASAYLVAAQADMRRYRNDSALSLSERGLALADAAVAHEIACFRGDMLRLVGEIQGSIDAFKRALKDAQDDAGRSRAWIGMAEGLRASDRHDEAREALDKAERLGTHGSTLALAEIHHLRGNLFFPTGRADECFAQHQLALEFARKSGSHEWEARALGGLGDAAYLAGRMRTACDNFSQCVELSLNLGLGRIEVANRHMVGWSRLFLNETNEAGEDARAAIEMATRVGQSRAEMIARGLLCLVHIERGETEAANNEAARYLAITKRLGAAQFSAQAHCWLARIHAAQMRFDEARTCIGEAASIVRRAGTGFFGPLVLGVAARLAPDANRRQALLSEANAALERRCVSHNHFWFRREAIEIALENTQWIEAERQCQELERYASAEPLPWSNLFAARGRALARFGRGSRDQELVQELSAVASALQASGLLAHLPPVVAALRTCDAE